MSPSPSEFATFVNLLRWRAEAQREQRVYTYLLDGERDEVHRSYGELDARARAIAAELQQRHLSGERALLVYPPGFEYIAAFLGCLYAGVVAAPLAPPDPGRIDHTLPPLQAIAKASQAAAVLTTTSLVALKTAPGLSLDGLQWIGTDFIDTALGSHWEPPRLDSDSLAFLQYTSGSTGTPKGVMLSHRNLMDNSEAIYRLSEGNSEDVQVSWIPHFHNMGLIGGILQPIYAGHLGILMSPLSFLQRPMRWLEAMSRFQATISPGPNFAFELCAQRFRAEGSRGSPNGEVLDLSRWRLACSGAEPIRAGTLDLFTETFTPYGFCREAFYPAYGLAEATLIVSGGKCSESPVVGKFQEPSLHQNKAVAADRLDSTSKNLVGCGRTLEGQTLLIVDPERRIPCRSGDIGEIWVSGPSVAQGYWNLPEETERTFRGYLAETGAGPFLRTGDLGFLSEGELFVTGRLKELIIIRGENRYPQDIEATVEKANPAVRPSGTAAFAIEDEGGEHLIIMAEVEEGQRDNWDHVLAAIRAAISQHHKLQTHDVVLLRGGGVPKTPTGKIQRRRCRTAYLNGEYEALAQWSHTSAQASGDSPATVRLDAIEAGTLAAIAQRLNLAPGDLKLDATLGGYGLDSLSALDLAQTLEEKLQVAVPLSLLFESVSIGHILDQLKLLPKIPPGSKGRVDLFREATLDEGITPASARRERGDSKNPRSIFLTGATGFVGAYLLKELANTTDADLYCLVRVSSALSEKQRIASAREKVQKNLETFGLWDEKLAARVIGVPGDLASPRMGLSQQEFQKLAGTVDAIYHNGASVNFIYPYRDLKASNVSGTQEILRFACQETLKPVHYISTIGVFPGSGDPTGRSFTENDSLDSCYGLLNAYSESKWVAEKVLQIGRSRGIPITIYRLGEVVGGEKTGALNAHRDVTSNMIKGALEIGKVPQINLNWYLVPVDFAAGAVVYLSLRPDSEGQTFHLVNPEPLSLAEVYRSLASLGYPLDAMPYRDWLKEVSDFTRVFPKNALTSFLPFLKREAVTALGETKTLLKLDCRRTWEALADAPLVCPSPRALLNRLISYLENSGFLFISQPEPDRVGIAFFPN